MTNIVSIAAVSAQRKTSLINRYIAKQKELAALKADLEELKVEAIELLGEGDHTTTHGKVSIHWTERPILDQAKAKSLLTPAQLGQCFKTSSFYDVRVKGA
jgi:hypothetical protein